MKEKNKKKLDAIAKKVVSYTVGAQKGKIAKATHGGC